MIDLVELVGISAGICTATSFIPQIRKILLTKATKDISLYMYIVYCTGLILWITYGVLISSFSVISANFFTLILAVSILILKLRFDLNK